MRFQLDPRGPGRAKPPSPPPAQAPAQPPGRATPVLPVPATPLTPFPAKAPTQPVPLPRPKPAAGPSAQEPRRRRTRTYAIVAVLLLLFAGGGTAAVYVMELPPFEYPRRYMLEGDELPSRMRMADVPSDFTRESGVEESPGRIAQDDLRQFGQAGAPTPEDGWVEFLTPTSSVDPVMVMALRFADDKAASSWTGLVSLRCSSVGGAVLRDADVVVVVAAESATAKLYLTRVVDALRAEAPDLKVVCAPGR